MFGENLNLRPINPGRKAMSRFVKCHVRPCQKSVDHLSVLPPQDHELVRELISDLLGEGGDGFRNVFGWMNCLQGGCIGFVTEMVT